jgi:Mg-chelatase subunit ChlD
LTVQAPRQNAAAADLQNLTVSLGDESDSEQDAVSYQVKHLDQMLTIDRSGSMAAPAAAPKMTSAKNAASLFVSAARAGDKLGVVSFSGDDSEPNDDATLDALLQVMNTGNRVQARNQIATLTANGFTSIGDGIADSAAEYPIRGTAIGEDRIVLLSDGMENEGSFWNNVRGAVMGAGIKVDTIALGPLTDQALLQQIASDTGGAYYYVDVSTAGAAATTAHRLDFAGAGGASSLANRLADAFFGSAEDAGDLQRFWDTRGSMPAGTSSEVIDLHEDRMVNAEVAINWPDTKAIPDVRLFDPNGNQVTPGPGVDVNRTDRNVVFQVDDMVRGRWTLKLDNPGTPLPFIAMAAGQEHQGVQLWVSRGTPQKLKERIPDSYRWGEPMPIVASLTDRGGAITDSHVTAHVTHPDGTVLDLPLFDDGNHADSQAGDGIYANTYTRTTDYATRGTDDLADKPNGSYGVRVTADGTAHNGDSFRRIENTSFAVFENGDPSPDSDRDKVADLYEGLHPQCMKVGDPGDVSLDPDNDRLDAFTEWRAGTDPCRPDTDNGGEPDGSELKRGANPFDPRDDALPRPEDPSVISRPIDHLGQPTLKSNTLLIRYPANPTYHVIRLWRSTSAAGPFRRIKDFDSTKRGGRYRDVKLVNGRTYFYKIQGIDFAGNPSTMSPVFSGTPKAHPFAPIGEVEINRGRTYTDSASVRLGLRTDSPVKQMQVSNNGVFKGAAWEPLAPGKAWTLEPGPDGFATVHTRFRDKWGNLSNPVSDEIRVRPGLVSISGQVKPDVPPGDGTMDGIYLWLVEASDLTIVRSNVDGTFTFPALPPGSYEVAARGAGYSTDSPVLLQPGVTTTVPVTCHGTC